MFKDTSEELEVTKDTLVVTKDKLTATRDVLKDTQDDLQVTRQDRDEQCHLVSEHVTTEDALHTEATQVNIIILNQIRFSLTSIAKIAFYK